MPRDRTVPRIVVGVDGSPSSHAALRWAVRQASVIGVVDAVIGWEVPTLYGWNPPVVDTALDLENTRRRLEEELRDVLGDERPVDVRGRVVRAHPVGALLDAARGAELLVVGSRGQGSFGRALLGSVSQQCALHATCPVVIVRRS